MTALHSRKRQLLPQLWPLQVLLVNCGLVVLYSNTSLNGLLRHSVWLLLGAVLILLLLTMDLALLWRLTPLLVLIAFLLNLAPHVPGIGLANAGSSRWIRVFGVSLQTSEILKFAMILYLSRMCALLDNKNLSWKKLFIPGLVIAGAMVVVILQKDYSTTLLLLTVVGIMLFFFSPMLSLYVFALAVLATLLAFFALNQNFRLQRFDDWLGEGSEQINWVHQAFVRGGWWGIGMGRGERKFIIPAAMTDFPLSSVGEEAGVLGIGFVILLFLLYTVQGLRLAKNCSHSYTLYLSLGLMSLFGLQVLVNLLVTAGLVPVTGQPLPFFSVGGSAAVMNMANFGLMNRILMWEKKRGASA